MGKKKESAKVRAKKNSGSAGKKPTGGRDAPAKAGKISGKDYDKEMRKLHVELVKLQQWVVHKGLKVCIVFEGRDGAGKGGTIKAITERVSPRVFRVVALPAPTEREKSQMYAQRYIPHLPAAGEIVIFDRSWYNRAGVERVMGFCTEEQAKGFLKVAPMFEKLLETRDQRPDIVAGWFASHPMEEDRIAAVVRIIRSAPRADGRTLVRDDPAFHEFQERVRRLPPSPIPTPPANAP